MLNAAGEVLYVGKALDLHKRVASYFRAGSAHSPRIRVMLMQVNAIETTENLFSVLGVRPYLGQDFPIHPKLYGPENQAIISHRLWQSRFNGDRNVIGKVVHLNAYNYTVVGVMPAGFSFPGQTDLWQQLRWDVGGHTRFAHFMESVGRVKPGVAPERVQRELATLTARLAAENKPSNLNWSARVVPLDREVAGLFRPALFALLGASSLLLLIACINVANLLLARAETRTREVAVRHALGANHRRLVRQFLTESLLLGLIGGALGILVAAWAVDGVTALMPKSAPRADEIRLDGIAVLFAVACAVGAALLFGLAPIVHARRTDVYSALKDGGGRTTSSKARLRVRRALVIAEIALAVVLVIGCTVMVRSLIHLQRVDVGFDPSRTLVFGVELPQKSYPGVTGDVFWSRLEQRMKALPGVESVAMLDSPLPLRPLNANDFSFPDKPMNMLVPANVDFNQLVNADAFAALGARIAKGRGITAADTLTAPPVVVVNEAFARRFFPGEDPLGKRLYPTYIPNAEKLAPSTVVGVVADIKNAGIDKPAGTELFIPREQYSRLNDPPAADNIQYVMLRSTSADPRDLLPAVHQAMATLDPNLPLFKIDTMDDVMWEAVARPRFLTFLLSAFAVMALLLAGVGIYGVMAHTVEQRTHEIGLRIALGAQPRQVRWMVLRQAGSLAVIGAVAGIAIVTALQFALGAKMKTVLYGAALADPLVLGGVAVVVLGAALLATWIPARRATTVEPMIALRTE